MQLNNQYMLIDAPKQYCSTQGLFACQVIGESMNRVIPNGSICLFKRYTGGSRNGKIVLVENFDYQDPDFNSAFTIKTYSSQKKSNCDSWRHTLIVLRPNSYDKTYHDIILTEENSDNMRIVGTFVTILERTDLI
jgi:phage repressor protein C with HTH and peptisase S24 domain